MTNGWRTRAKARMDELGMTPADFGRKTGWGKTAFRDYFIGQPDKGKAPSEPTVERARIIAHVLGTTLATLFEDDETTRSALSINGLLRGKDGMWVPLSGKASRSIPLNILSGDVSVVLLDDNEQEPEYHKGDVLCGPKMSGRGIDNVVNRDCIVETVDGVCAVRYLIKGSKPGKYVLRSIKRGPDDMVDVRLKWAAPIQMILRGV